MPWPLQVVMTVGWVLTVVGGVIAITDRRLRDWPMGLGLLGLWIVWCACLAAAIWCGA